MGVDLTLLPLTGDLGYQWLAHNTINVVRRSELLEDVEKLPQHVIPYPVACHHAIRRNGEACYGDISKDKYGQKLKWTTVADLRTLRKHEGVTDNWQNKAIWAYLSKMPSDWKIVLFWH